MSIATKLSELHCIGPNSCSQHSTPVTNSAMHLLQTQDLSFLRRSVLTLPFLCIYYATLFEALEGWSGTWRGS